MSFHVYRRSQNDSLSILKGTDVLDHFNEGINVTSVGAKAVFCVSAALQMISLASLRPLLFSSPADLHTRAEILENPKITSFFCYRRDRWGESDRRLVRGY